MKDTIHISLCTDRNYVMPTGVTIISVCENNKEEKLHFHIIYTDDDECAVTPLYSIVEKYGATLTVHYFDKEKLEPYKCSGSAEHVTPTGFARVFLPEILSEEITKVIYLDSDVIVSGSLRGLWDFSLKDTDPIGACIDTNVVEPGAHNRVDTPMSIPYCNSGVLLINLDCWRREGLQQQMCVVAREHQFPLLDQDAINYLFKDRIKILPFEYNVQLGFYLSGCDYMTGIYKVSETFDKALQSPVVIHYSFPEKPWGYNGIVHGEKWWHYAKKSPWRDELPTPKSSSSFKIHREIEQIRMTAGVFPEQFNEFFLDYATLFSSAVRLRHGRNMLKIVSVILVLCTKVTDWVYNYNLGKHKN